jgi:hypothetical protein
VVVADQPTVAVAAAAAVAASTMPWLCILESFDEAPIT